MVGLDVDRIADLEVWRRNAPGVGRVGVAFASFCDLLLEGALKVVDINGEVAGACGSDVALGENGDTRVKTLGGVERRNAGGGTRSIVVSKLGDGKEITPVGLLVVAVNPEVLLEGLVNTLYLTVGFGMVSRGVVYFDVEKRG